MTSFVQQTPNNGSFLYDATSALGKGVLSGFSQILHLGKRYVLISTDICANELTKGLFILSTVTVSSAVFTGFKYAKSFDADWGQTFFVCSAIAGANVLAMLASQKISQEARNKLNSNP